VPEEAKRQAVRPVVHSHGAVGGHACSMIAVPVPILKLLKRGELIDVYITKSREITKARNFLGTYDRIRDGLSNLTIFDEGML
jgi:hypothetical protein